ncbi:MAG: 2-phosphosulfolactate phosphatase, partial [Jatrophihabitans sp.]
MAADVTASPFAQAGARVRFEWGLPGALALAEHTASQAVFVVVDVLSFCTSISVACDLGIACYPYRWTDDRAQQYADARSAVLAGGRRQGGLSLSPASLRAADGVRRLVLPSPNGSTISFALRERGCRVVAGCLRNATAVGSWLDQRLQADSTLAVAVIAAGERWPDGSLRPAIEDLWGAGAILGAIGAGLTFSPEARGAMAGFAAVAGLMPEQLRACASGRELSRYGFGGDVEIAAEGDSTTVVPVLVEDRFLPAPQAIDGRTRL